MRTAKRVLVVAAVSCPLMLGATTMAMADDYAEGSPTQVQNQDEIQVSKPTNANFSPANVLQVGGGTQIADTAPTQTNNADQNQVGDWDGNSQNQEVGSHSSPTQEQDQDEVQVSKPTNANFSPANVLQVGGGTQIAATGPTQTNNANQNQEGDWEDNTQNQVVGPH
jgi:hypothetical protein